MDNYQHPLIVNKLYYSYLFLLLLFQHANTRFQKGDKGDRDQAKASDLDEGDLISEADLSLMGRTKKQAKAARDNLKKNVQACSSLEEEAMGLEELLAKSREKAEATKAARDRVARLRRELEEFESEQHHVFDSDQDHDQEPLSHQPVLPAAPVSAPAAPDVASALATSLQAAVIIIAHFLRIFIHSFSGVGLF